MSRPKQTHDPRLSRDRLLRTLFVILVSSSLSMMSGCLVPIAVGAAAGIGAMEYSEGALTATVPGRLGDQVWPAAMKLAADRHWRITSQEPGPNDALLRAEDEYAHQIEMTFTRQTSGDFTRVSVRIGTFGDESASRKIVDDLRARIKS